MVSILVAWITSRVSDREKTRLAAEQRNLEILIGARLKEYPALYALLSDIPKAFDLWPTVTLDPAGLLKKFNEWDSQHAILMSSDTSNCCSRFRHALVMAVHKKRVPSQIDSFGDVQVLAQDLEHALRSDLGLQGFKQEGGIIVPEKEKGWFSVKRWFSEKRWF
jgi:hypothetical protein